LCVEDVRQSLVDSRVATDGTNFAVTGAMCLTGTESGRLTQTANRNTVDNLTSQRVTYASLAPENSLAGAHIERE
jgi:hypothetical protein